MATKNDTNSFYGMRVIGQMNNIIGLLWTVEEEQLVLYSYYRDAYNNYLCDRMEEIPLSSACRGGKVTDAFTYLKRICDRKKPSYKIYMTRDCYRAINDQYVL